MTHGQAIDADEARQFDQNLVQAAHYLPRQAAVADPGIGFRPCLRF